MLFIRIDNYRKIDMCIITYNGALLSIYCTAVITSWKVFHFRLMIGRLYGIILEIYVVS